MDVEPVGLVLMVHAIPCRHVAQLSWEVGTTGADDSCKATAAKESLRLWTSYDRSGLLISLI